jgi:hypothetical protein
MFYNTGPIFDQQESNDITHSFLKIFDSKMERKVHEKAHKAGLLLR